jgi:hypothetical protein
MTNSITVLTDYNASVSTEVELPCGRTWDDVEEWGIKWGTLHIYWRDGTKTERELAEVDPGMIDVKRPSQVTIESGSEPYEILDEL